jgi:predicted exporter
LLMTYTCLDSSAGGMLWAIATLLACIVAVYWWLPSLLEKETKNARTAYKEACEAGDEWARRLRDQFGLPRSKDETPAD